MDGGAGRGTEREKRTIECVISAYCRENYPHICNDGESTYTSTGAVATVGRTIAVDPSFVPYGTSVEIEGVGVRIAEDCGGAINGNRIDLLFETHQEALEWGIQTRKVTILN
jgi:3D (Asp-Asp-Asp) domain-containing protein